MKIFERVCNFLRGRLLACLLCCGAVCIAPVTLAAQEGQGAVIYRVAGNDFAVSRNGSRTVIPAAAIGASGMTLDRAGIVHNGSGTFIELQLIPSGAVVMLSENTSLVYNGPDETGNFEELGLLYGRIRIVTGDVKTPVVIRCGGVSARLKDGDFGADYLLEPDDPDSVSRPLFRVYAFRGSAEVFPYGTAGNRPAYFGNVEELTANAGECLFMDIAASEAASRTFAEKRPIEEGLAAYWRERNFQGTSPMPMPNTVLALPEEKVETVIVQAPPVVVQEPGMRYIYRAPSRPIFEKRPAPIYYGKNITLGVGLLMTITSVIALGVTHPDFIVQYENKDLVRNIHSMAYLPLGMGVLATLGGIMFNPTEK